jgi:hypothetical protein
MTENYMKEQYHLLLLDIKLAKDQIEKDQAIDSLKKLEDTIFEIAGLNKVNEIRAAEGLEIYKR